MGTGLHLASKLQWGAVNDLVRGWHTISFYFPFPSVVIVNLTRQSADEWSPTNDETKANNVTNTRFKFYRWDALAHIYDTWFAFGF